MSNLRKTGGWSRVLFLAVPLAMALTAVVIAPARAALTSENDLRSTRGIQRDAVVVTWAERTELGQRDELPQFMTDFYMTDPLYGEPWGESSGLARYGYPLDFPSVCQELVINANDYADTPWASRIPSESGTSFQPVTSGWQPYWFTDIGRIFDPNAHVRLHVFAYQGSWMDRVCGNFTYGASPRSSELDVDPLTVPCSMTTPVILTAHLLGLPSREGLPGREVDFYVDGSLVGSATTDDSGSAWVGYTVPAESGEHTMLARFGGDQCYIETSGSNDLGNAPASSSVQVTPVSGVATRPVALSAHLEIAGTDAGGQVLHFTVNGAAVADGQTASNGVAVSSFTPPASGTYTVTASFNGAACVTGSAGAAPATINAAPTSLSVADAATQCGESPTLSATLKDDQGVPVSNRTINFGVDGQTLVAVTGADGIARVTAASPESVGSYPIAASFAGDAVYGASGGSATLTVIHRAMTLTYKGDTQGECLDTTDLSAALTYTDGIGMPAPGQMVVFSITGAGGTRTYNAATDSQGNASVSPTLDLPSGDYTISASFAGDDCLGSAQASASYKIQPEPTILTCAGDHSGQYTDNTTLAAVLTDHDGQPLAGKTVTFQLGSQSGQGVTDAAGRASCSIILNQCGGPYTVTIGFVGDATYGPGQATCPYTILQENATLQCLNTDVVRCGGADDLGTVTLQATVIEEQDGLYGDITQAPVYFVVTDQDGVQRRFPAAGYIYPTQTVPGSGEATLQEQLPTGIYTVQVFMGDNACYIASPSALGSIVVFCPDDGFVTGGGTIALPGGGKGSFGLEVKYLPGDRLQGNLQYVDHAAGLDLHSVSLDWLVITRTPRGERADFSGTVLDKTTGNTTSFRVEVEDNGEPGTNDTFHIRLATGYEAAGPDRAQNTLTGGNIQIHSSAPQRRAR